MEYGIKIKELEELEKISPNYKYIYFGNEFCEKKIPSVEEIIRILEYCNKNNKTLVLLTPPLTNKGVEVLKGIIREVPKGNNFEITINDFGILETLKNIPNIRINCGRTLIRMKKGPEIMTGILNEPPEHFKDNSLSNPDFREIIKGLGIKRFEVDLPPQGINLPKKEDITLYLGNSSVSLTRRCIYPKCDTEEYDYKIGNCKKECLFQIITKQNEYYNQPIFVVGNAEIIKTQNTIPAELRDSVNRIVIFPNIKTNL